jgi:hypothetical protein
MKHVPLGVALGWLERIFKLFVAPSCCTDISEVRSQSDGAYYRWILKYEVPLNRLSDTPTAFHISCVGAANDLRVAGLATLSNIDLLTARGRAQLFNWIRINHATVLLLVLRRELAALGVRKNHRYREGQGETGKDTREKNSGTTHSNSMLSVHSLHGEESVHLRAGQFEAP